MPTFAMQITIGGLCMLSVEKDDAGTPVALHVLMPKMRGPGMVHLPMLVCEAKVVTGATERQIVPIDRRVIDLRAVRNTAATPLGKLPAQFPRASTFAQKPLDRQWLSVTEEQLRADPTLPLATRIVLDARVTLVTHGHVAVMDVLHGNFQPPGEKLDMVGRGIVTISGVDTAVLPDLKTQFGLDLKPAKNGILAIELVNIMSHDLDHMHDEEVKKGAPSEHFVAYYDLLETPAITRPIPKAHDNDVVPAEHHARFIQPYRCTVSVGCPPGDPTC